MLAAVAGCSLGSRNNPGSNAMLAGIESEQPVVMGYMQPFLSTRGGGGAQRPRFGALPGHLRAKVGPATHNGHC
jgi:hypothetical protein